MSRSLTYVRAHYGPQHSTSFRSPFPVHFHFIPLFTNRSAPPPKPPASGGPARTAYPSMLACTTCPIPPPSRPPPCTTTLPPPTMHHHPPAPHLHLVVPRAPQAGQLGAGGAGRHPAGVQLLGQPRRDRGRERGGARVNRNRKCLCGPRGGWWGLTVLGARYPGCSCLGNLYTE